jgi:hypothetical protein
MDTTTPTPSPTKGLYTFEITYYNEDLTIKNVDVVAPVPFSQWGDLILLQEKLLKFAVLESIQIQSFLTNPEMLSTIKTIAGMLRVVGKKEPGIDIDNLLESGNYLDIARMFLSEGFDGVSDIRENYLPSAVARIHQLDFTGKLNLLIIERGLNQQVKVEEDLIEMVTPKDPKPSKQPKKTD